MLFQESHGKLSAQFLGQGKRMLLLRFLPRRVTSRSPVHKTRLLSPREQTPPPSSDCNPQHRWAGRPERELERGVVPSVRIGAPACARRGGVAQTPGRKQEAAGAGRLASPFRLVPMEALGKLKQFDAYPKTLEDFRVKTCGGATGRPLRGRGRGDMGVRELGLGAWTRPGLWGA